MSGAVVTVGLLPYSKMILGSNLLAVRGFSVWVDVFLHCLHVDPISGLLFVFFCCSDWAERVSLSLVRNKGELSPSHCPLLRGYSRAIERQSHLAGGGSGGLEDILPKPLPMRPRPDTETL